mgnify:FL=1|tara:strand:- start:264 stop:1382 length:1119 start_codon:yes stop_codon:yes gene_type:complete
MSDMLEQAIIDAEALKEAAVKNAETLVLEQYSGQIKEAVQAMLEQEDPLADLGGGDPLGGEAGAGDPAAAGPAAGEGAESAESNVIKHIPLVADARGPNETVTIPLDSLMEELKLMSESLEHQLEEEFTFDEGIARGVTDALVDYDPDAAGPGQMNEEEELEEVELDEEFISDLAEALKVDILPVKSGFLSTPESAYELAEEEILALEQDSEVRERKAAMRRAVEELKAVNEVLQSKNDEISESLDEAKDFIVKLRDAVVVLKEKMEATSLSNARLLYQNKALTSDSLNGRQKRKLAEAVSKATTIEEAKVIYETLHSTVGSTNPAKQPNSLREAVEKSSSVILAGSRKAEKSQKEDPSFDRWRFLAGLNKD